MGLSIGHRNCYWDKDVSVTDLKGNTKTRNKGLCDVLMFKIASSQQLFQQELVVRATETCSSLVQVSKWVDQEVAPRMSSFLTW